MIDNYYFKGCVSGMVGILISHPVDSIKTHYQIQKNIIKTSYKYTVSNLYKGVTSPLFGVGLEKALVFGTYNYVNNITNNTPLSGAVSGLVASIIVSPYERIKIMKQTNQKIILSDCLKPKFIFKGLSATFTREIPGFAIYFSTYEGLKKIFFNSNIVNYPKKNISIPVSFIFGGLSGLTAWVFIYPQDRIKTIIQSNSNNISINNIIKNIYNTGGLKQFYKGFSFAAARAILLHSGTFCTMEILSQKANIL
jgi:solute carrier family 25 carnitine/acylcarnitine transporter 20/29